MGDSKIFNQKNCFRTFAVISIITITALSTVLIIKTNSQAGNNGVSDESNVDYRQDYPSPPKPDGCHPIPDGKIPQFLIGYGSLMQTASKLKTYPNAAENIPVNIHGFSRHWNIEGKRIGFSTTYLGVEKDSGATTNGVIFQIPGASPTETADAILNYDTRELYYCRLEVLPENIEVLNRTDEIDRLTSKTEKRAQFWIYYNLPVYSKPASAKYPIVQSYVDVFISGCIELEEKFKLHGFAKKCITGTKGWSSHWVNDRLLPRRPASNTPKASKIDILLAEVVPEAFKTIKIEG